MSSIGEILKEARQKKGVTEEVAAKALKIKVERIRDLEENCYEHFKAQLYIRSFLRHYTEYLGIESGPILQRFAEESPAPEQKPIFEITEEQRANSPVQRHLPAQPAAFFLTATGKTVFIATILILILIGVGFWWVITTRHHFQSPQTNTPTPALLDVPPFSPPTSPIENEETSTSIAPIAPIAPLAPLALTNNPPTEIRRTH
jgi:cytoskeletal protein RodZ